MWNGSCFKSWIRWSLKPILCNKVSHSIQRCSLLPFCLWHNFSLHLRVLTTVCGLEESWWLSHSEITLTKFLLLFFLNILKCSSSIWKWLVDQSWTSIEYTSRISFFADIVLNWTTTYSCFQCIYSIFCCFPINTFVWRIVRELVNGFECFWVCT